MAAVKQKRERVALLDEIRGFCILCMVFYHGFYLFGSIGGVPFCTALFRFFEPLQMLFASAFICLSGVCTQFSRSVLRRGAFLLGIALTLSAVTILIFPRLGLDGMQDRFGILHLLACCMLLYGVCRKALQKIPPVWTAVTCIVLYLLTYRVPSGQIGLPFCSVPIPDALLQTRFLFPLGLHDAAFFSADYFPLLPHGFVFFLGCAIASAACARGWPPSVCRMHVRPLAFCGRYSLWIYLLHAPALIAAALLLRSIIV